MKDKGKINYKSVTAGLVLIIIGILMIVLEYNVFRTQRSVLISIGCSLLASGLVVLLQAVFVDIRHFDYAEEWGLTKIYKARSEKNEDSDPKLIKVKEHLDIIAFGLKNFRENHGKDVEKIVRNGVQVRILTMNPEDNLFLIQREKEENETDGAIKKSIEDLIEWAKKINKKNKTADGGIIVRGYKCMTLDFYWRADNDLYIGPYWYGRGSQSTVTYKFEKGKRGFDLYTEYFEQLWQDENNTVLLEQKGLADERTIQNVRFERSRYERHQDRMHSKTF